MDDEGWLEYEELFMEEFEQWQKWISEGRTAPELLAKLVAAEMAALDLVDRAAQSPSGRHVVVELPEARTRAEAILEGYFPERDEN